jgi:hypothetical protein
MGSRGDSSEQKLIEQILEDSRAGTLARILDHSDSNKDREQLVKNLGAIVIVQAYLGLRSDIPIRDPGTEPPRNANVSDAIGGGVDAGDALA